MEEGKVGSADAQSFCLVMGTRASTVLMMSTYCMCTVLCGVKPSTLPNYTE